jgi:hypothetical protein
MSELKRVGFFHFGSDEKCDPLGSLEAEIKKQEKLELAGALLVLPEAFNVRGGYYSDRPQLGDKPQLDQRAVPRLQTLSAERGIVFVAGIIDGVGGNNSAYLIDGRATPKLLTQKRTAGRPCLYTHCEASEDRFIPFRGVGITALICDDAANATGDFLSQTVSRVKNLNMKHSVLCIPAYMRPTVARDTATRWGKLISVVLANGDKEQHSAIVFGGQEKIPGRLDQNEIQLCDLEPGSAQAGRPK